MRGIVSLFALVVFLLPAFSADAADRYTVTGSGGNETITEHTVCREVTNDNAASIMVPTKTKPEWCSFIDNTPSNVTLADCGGGGADLYCWGYNTQGQLGDGTTMQRTSPTLTLGGYEWVSITAGNSQSKITCGITSTQDAYCWGYNLWGAVGDGTTTDRHSPTLVSGGHAWSMIFTGTHHTCGITTSGAAYCWGYNQFGRLGDGTTTQRNSPSLVSGGHTWQSLSLGGQERTCGLTTAGDAYCWGANMYGELGDGTTTDRHSPALVSGGHTWKSITYVRALSACGITTSDVGYCWGRNNYGFLGDGTTTNRHVPTLVVGGHTWKSLGGACGITTSDVGYCWGINSFGAVGDGTTTQRNSPTLISGGHTWQYIQPSSFHSCGLTTAGAAYCWGANWYGSLGDGTTTDRLVPALVVGGHTWKKILVGKDYSGYGEITACGITTSDDAYCWGANSQGAIGDGTTTQRTSPTLVSGGHTWEAIQKVSSFTCARLTGSGGGGGTCP